MTIANIQSVLRNLPELGLREVVFTFSSDQSTKSFDLSIYGFQNFATNPILEISEFSGIPANGSNLLSSSLATLSGMILTINNANTRMIRVVGR